MSDKWDFYSKQKYQERVLYKFWNIKMEKKIHHTTLVLNEISPSAQGYEARIKLITHEEA